MKLNDVIDIKLGSKQVKYVYSGNYLVWGGSTIISYNTNNNEAAGITIYKPENITKVYNSYDSANNYGEVRFYGGELYKVPRFLFYQCRNVTSITLPDTIIEISDSAFRGCTSLTHIDIPDSVKEFTQSTFSDCSNLQTIKLSNNLTSICGGCFSGCSSLESLTVPTSVETIDYQAFSGTTSLNELVLNDGLKVISQEILSGSRLKTLVVPETVEKLHFECFGQAVLLESIYFKSATPPEAVFNGPYPENWLGFYKAGSYTSTGKTTIYVPIGSGDLYRNAAGWNEYASQIVEYDFNS